MQIDDFASLSDKVSFSFSWFYWLGSLASLPSLWDQYLTRQALFEDYLTCGIPTWIYFYQFSVFRCVVLSVREDGLNLDAVRSWDEGIGGYKITLSVSFCSCLTLPQIHLEKSHLERKCCLCYLKIASLNYRNIWLKFLVQLNLDLSWDVFPAAWFNSSVYSWFPLERLISYQMGPLPSSTRPVSSCFGFPL